MRSSCDWPDEQATTSKKHSQPGWVAHVRGADQVSRKNSADHSAVDAFWVSRGQASRLSRDSPGVQDPYRHWEHLLDPKGCAQGLRPRAAPKGWRPTPKGCAQGPTANSQLPGAAPNCQGLRPTPTGCAQLPQAAPKAQRPTPNSQLPRAAPNSQTPTPNSQGRRPTPSGCDVNFGL
jgi:hypothetical protein